MCSAPGARPLRVITQPALGAEAGGAAVAPLEALVVRQHLVHVQQHPPPLPRYPRQQWDVSACGRLSCFKTGGHHVRARACLQALRASAQNGRQFTGQVLLQRAAVIETFPGPLNSEGRPAGSLTRSFCTAWQAVNLIQANSGSSGHTFTMRQAPNSKSHSALR